MKRSIMKTLSFLICVLMLLPAFNCLAALADESSADTSSGAAASDDWEDVWKNVKLPAYTSSTFSTVGERILGGGDISPMRLMTVNDGYAFFADEFTDGEGDSFSTGELIILSLKDKTLTKDQIVESGNVPEYTAFYCTNPYNVGSAKALGSEQPTDASEKANLLSQIIIKYSENDKDTTMNSFTDAAASRQITVKNIRGGVRVEYTIGREEVTYLVPRLIKAEKLIELLRVIDERSPSRAGSPSSQFHFLKRDSRTVEAYYIYYNIDEMTPNQRKAVEANYPCVKNFPIFVCDKTTSSVELLRIEKLIKAYSDYTYEQLDADHAETDYSNSDNVPPLFKLALEYRADGDEITIRCNAGNIRFDSSIYKLSDVQVLPYGGAGDVNNKGYLLSPDGSGSLIRFSDLSKQFSSSASLYGQDYAYHTITGENKEVARLPAFGVYQRIEKNSTKKVLTEKIDPETGEYVRDENGNIVMEEVEVDVPLEIAYLAVIEEGDSLAKVNLNYGGSVHNFASVYTSFNPRPKDSYVLDGGISAGTDAMWTVESKRKYTGNFTMRLFILDGTEDGDTASDGSDADKSYSDMAAAYRSYLIKTNVLTEIADQRDSIPLYLETLGALESSKTVLGVPVDTMVSLTSFSDTKDIIDELKNRFGIDYIKIKMSGWANGGLISDVPTSLDPEKVLGGKDGLKDLIAYAKENGVTLFPEVELSVAYKDKWFDGFDSSKNLSQYIDERIALYQRYDPIWQGYLKNGGGGVISPSFMKTLYAKAYEDYKEYNVGAIAVSTLGKYLSSDFNVDNPLTREDSKELVTQLLQTISENNGNVLVSGGNKYSIKYATDILEVPLDDSRYTYSYTSVPFMSMVLHGYKQYAGTALNLAGDYTYQILKSIESGASPYFVVAKSNTAKLKDYSGYSDISQYYSVRYSIWTSDIINSYRTMNEALADVQSSEIRKHDILSSDGNIVYVEYANGISFCFNYGRTGYEFGGETVPPNGFVKFDKDGNSVMKWEGSNE